MWLTCGFRRHLSCSLSSLTSNWPQRSDLTLLGLNPWVSYEHHSPQSIGNFIISLLVFNCFPHNPARCELQTKLGNGIIPYNRMIFRRNARLDDLRECGNEGGDVTGTSPMPFSGFDSVDGNDHDYSGFGVCSPISSIELLTWSGFWSTKRNVVQGWETQREPSSATESNSSEVSSN